MSKFQIVKGITDNLADTPYVEGKVYFVYNDVASTDLSIYADIDGARRKITPITFEEEDPTVPDWAKQETKPTYTAAEVGALPSTTSIPSKTSDLTNDSNFQTSSEVNSAIITAIGNINQFNVAIVSTLPTENIDTHTIYFISNGGSDDSIYDEWMYINNNWEKIGTTSIDLSGYMQTSHPANEITNTDISNWNAKISDDKTWNGVALNKTGGMGNSNIYVPYATSTNASSMNYWTASETPTGYAIAKYDSSAYLKSTTPSANDNSTKVATTAYVDAAIPKVYSSTNTNGYLTMATLPIYDGTVV